MAKKFRKVNKQESFLKHLGEGKTERDAARAAGYTEQSVTKGKFKRGDPVKRKIAKVKGSLAAQHGISKEDSLKGIKDAIEQAALLDDPATRIRGWDVINKMLGFNAPEVTLEVPLEDLSRAELQELSTEKLLQYINSNTLRDTRPVLDDVEYERLEEPDGREEGYQQGEAEAREAEEHGESEPSPTAECAEAEEDSPTD